PWEAVLEAEPDCLVIAPCGFDLDRTLRELPYLESLPGWRDLRAVRHGRVAFADGNRYFNRSGVTIVETAEMLAQMLHGPDVWPHAPRGAFCGLSHASGALARNH